MPKKRFTSKKRQKAKVKTLADANRSYLLTVAALIVFGVVMIYDATVIYSQGTLGDAYKLVVLQIGWVVLGLLGFYFFYRLDLERIKQLAFPLFLVSLGILLLLALAGTFSKCDGGGVVFMPCINGAHRWFFLNPPPLPALPVLGVLGFQPSEFAKFTLVLYLAVILAKNIREKESPFAVFIIVTGLVSGLVLLQPNMSTAALLFLIGLVMYFASGANLNPLLITIPAIVLGGMGFMFSSNYRRARLLTFLNPGETGELSLGYHIKQIQIALGSGGFLGLGFGQSRQKFSYLPEVAADSIFAIIGEEFGFLGTTAFILIFSFLIYQGFMIAKNSKDLFSRLLAVGITTWIAAQFFINIAAMTRLIPLTGIPLPLVSYGGSATVFSLMGLGILANVSSK
jgi:cell division protein FtsW